MRVLTPFLCAALVAGCGGNGGSGKANPPGSGSPKQSAGGIWHGLPGANESITFYIAETGELIVQTTSVATTPPALGFGTGAVIVNGLNDVAGTYRLLSLPSPTVAYGVVSDKTCEMDGTVTERSLLQAVLTCTDSAGSTAGQTVNMIYDPVYELDSALADIAGNYTVPFRPQTNTLNINASGVVFGMLDNGPTCTVNGRVQIIDARFNLYRVDLQMSLCQGPFGPLYEGATFRGFAVRNLPGPRAGAFLLLIWGTPTSFVTGAPPLKPPIQFFSLLYEPV